MVGRHEEIALVVVVDLDGTLLRCNSFRVYARLCLKHLWKCRRYYGFVRMACAAVLRKCGIISHNAYRQICVSSVGFPETLLKNLHEEMAGMYSCAVCEFVRRKEADGYSTLLATAALSGYVGAVWKGRYVASETKNGRIESDCRGITKLESVLRALDGRTPAYALSDNRADFPLLRYVAANGGKAILVNPDAETLRFLRQLEPPELFDVELLLDSGEAR